VNGLRIWATASSGLRAGSELEGRMRLE